MAATALAAAAIFATGTIQAQTEPETVNKSGDLSLSPDFTGNAAPPTALARVQEKALSLVGIRYRYGGKSPVNGFDCSGFVQYVMHTAIGVRIGRTAASQAALGSTVTRDDLRVGDLVFFNTRGMRFSHVGLYMGNGRFVHAPSSGGWVRVEYLNNPYWLTHYTTAKRLKVPALEADDR
ncbi:C40 family peptidase [Burkholderia ubonensis]|uniref:C40 family peptidase n=1 Tax=Burkholderia ubonensis TaxID=101571 RepID=UPI0009B316C7|nr:C40 family peptidase [Burkholderia ubonensis]